MKTDYSVSIPCEFDMIPKNYQRGDYHATNVTSSLPTGDYQDK